MEEELFQLKQKFLREIPHPKVIASYHKRTGEILNSNVILNTNLGLIEFLKEYSRELMPIKLKIAHAKNKTDFGIGLNFLYGLQMDLIGKLASYASINTSEFREIKVGAPIQNHRILQFLKERELKENSINEFIEKELASKEIANFTVLTENVIRAKLIFENER